MKICVSLYEVWSLSFRLQRVISAHGKDMHSDVYLYVCRSPGREEGGRETHWEAYHFSPGE